jgi:succinate-acetate transporter protein
MQYHSRRIPPKLLLTLLPVSIKCFTNYSSKNLPAMNYQYLVAMILFLSLTVLFLVLAANMVRKSQSLHQTLGMIFYPGVALSCLLIALMYGLKL